MEEKKETVESPQKVGRREALKRMAKAGLGIGGIALLSADQLLNATEAHGSYQSYTSCVKYSSHGSYNSYSSLSLRNYSSYESYSSHKGSFRELCQGNHSSYGSFIG